MTVFNLTVQCPNNSTNSQKNQNEGGMIQNTRYGNNNNNNNNLGCNWIGKLNDLSEHILSCKFQLVNCPYLVYGCKITLLGNKLEQHLRMDVHKHLDMYSKCTNKGIRELRIKYSLFF